jgi:hypothetical protein
VAIQHSHLTWITVIRFVSIGAKFVTVVDLNGTPIEAKIRTTKCLKCIFWHLQVSIFRPKTVQMPNFSLIDTKRLQWFCWYEYILCFCYCISGSIFTHILVVAAAIFANCCVWCVYRSCSLCGKYRKDWSRIFCDAKNLVFPIWFPASTSFVLPPRLLLKRRSRPFFLDKRNPLLSESHFLSFWHLILSINHKINKK